MAIISYAKVNLFFILAMACMGLIQCYIVDVSQETFPEPLQVYRGSFWAKGKYKMVRSTAQYIEFIMHGNFSLYSTRDLKNKNADVFVEEHKRGDHILVAVLVYDTTSSPPLQRSYFEVGRSHANPVTRACKNGFVNGPLAVAFDKQKDTWHPVIDTMRRYRNFNVHLWYVICNHACDYRATTEARHWYGDGEYHVSPITNIECKDNDERIPPSTLSGHFHGFSNIGRRFYAVVMDPAWKERYSITIPPIVRGVFRPMNIVTYPEDLFDEFPLPIVSRPMNLQIDVSTLEGHCSEVVILGNLKRGNWLYTQYSILPRKNPLRMNVKVVNVQHDRTIYETTDDTFVTHVEVFHNYINKMEYVVVNTKKLCQNTPGNSPWYEYIKRVYSPRDNVLPLTYVDLTDQGRHVFLEMLYSIEADYPPIPAARRVSSSSDE